MPTDLQNGLWSALAQLLELMMRNPTFQWPHLFPPPRSTQRLMRSAGDHGIAGAFSAFADGEGEETLFTVDTKISKVYWTGSKVVGKHTGYMSVGNGAFTVEDEKLVTGNVNLDLNSIGCRNYPNEEWNQKLVEKKDQLTKNSNKQ